MPELFHTAVFWVVVVVVIRLAVCFPHSMLAKILFSRHGPLRVPGESKADYFLRCARFDGSWSMQALFLFVAGWVALQWDSSLVDSLFFLVLWAVVIPVLGGVAFLAAFFEIGRWLWARGSGRDAPAAGSQHATRT